MAADVSEESVLNLSSPAQSESNGVSCEQLRKIEDVGNTVHRSVSWSQDDTRVGASQNGTESSLSSSFMSRIQSEAGVSVHASPKSMFPRYATAVDFKSISNTGSLSTLFKMVDAMSSYDGFGLASRRAMLELLMEAMLPSFSESLQLILREFAIHCDWKYFEIWTLDAGNGVLTQSYSHSLLRSKRANDLLAKAHKKTTFRVGQGVPGRVWRKQLPEWISCLTDHRKFQRADLAFRCELQSAMCVPLLAGDRTEAAVMFFDCERRTDQSKASKATSELFALLEAARWRKRHGSLGASSSIQSGSSPDVHEHYINSTTSAASSSSSQTGRYPASEFLGRLSSR